MGAAAAVKYLRRDVAIVGTDVVTELIECIEDGTVSATIVRNSFGMGYLGVEYAAEALRGNAVPDERTLASVVVTRDNLFTAEIEKLFFHMNKKRKKESTMAQQTNPALNSLIIYELRRHEPDGKNTTLTG